MPSKHRRRHGEGSIYQRADGRWVGAVGLADGTRKIIYGKTRIDVQNSFVDVLKWISSTTRGPASLSLMKSDAVS